ncbi:GPW/gp25 family protein [Pedomonas mirosovicensis]|uniref:GPW/gp25 family protein n=1 Tax=Pedomonas mirosovicensis TaxID=2908641 RepID=UPI0021691E41|nr:GPW/gp25 family protein [Pedomonas mirosovicensis]MCH8686457.1 GPW/gp25 family protein [Pedomonas mirosovicensis]
MKGMSATTGKAIEGEAHLRQSINDILTTPIGSRVARRDYGSLLPELIDQPFNPTTRLRLYAAVAQALMRWEPRLRLSRVAIALSGEHGGFALTLEGTRMDAPAPNSLTRLTLPLRGNFT